MLQKEENDSFSRLFLTLSKDALEYYQKSGILCYLLTIAGRNLNVRQRQLIISLLSIFLIHDMYRDVAGVYAYYTREIGTGNWSAGWVGRVPMLHILLSGILALTGFEAYTATIMISSAFYILTLFPLRRLLERYLSPQQAAWGCLLFIFAPKVIRFSISGVLVSSQT